MCEYIYFIGLCVYLYLKLSSIVSINGKVLRAIWCVGFGVSEKCGGVPQCCRFGHVLHRKLHNLALIFTELGVSGRHFQCKELISSLSCRLCTKYKL